jgi:Cu+-exporting ATPase
MHCASCVAAVEDSIRQLNGVLDVTVNLASENAYVTYDPGQADPSRIEKAVVDSGYGIRRADKAEAAHDRTTEQLGRRFWLSLGFGVPLLYLAMGRHLGLPVPSADARLLALLQFLLTTPIIVGNWAVYVRGLRRLLKTRTANMDTLVSVGTGVAYLWSIVVSLALWFGRPVPGPHSGMPGMTPDLYFEVAGLLLVFITLGRWLEARARGRTSQAISRLVRLGAPTALRVQGGQEVEVPVEEVQVGDVLAVKPGARVPVDGEVTQGETTVDESMLTGESMPVDKRPGSAVTGGTLNQHGSFRFRASRVGKDTTLARIVRFVEEAQGSKAPIQALADRVAAVFVPVVTGLAVLSFVAWLVFAPGLGFGFALTKFIAVLVIACPCALGLATPTAIMVATGRGAELGILIRRGETLQRLAEVNAIVFDKTGTLTNGRPEVTDIVPAADASVSELLGVAAVLEERSEHPVAAAVVDAVRGQSAAEWGHSRSGDVPGDIRVHHKDHKGHEGNPGSSWELREFRVVPGQGLQARAESGEVMLAGNRALLADAGIDLAPLESKLVELEQAGKTTIIVSRAGRLLGTIAVADTPRETAQASLRALAGLGIEAAMLTGDNSRTAGAIAGQLGLTRVMAEVLPGDKSRAVRQLQEQGWENSPQRTQRPQLPTASARPQTSADRRRLDRKGAKSQQGWKVAMVGDGINDAPALAQADVGFAIGTGSDVAVESGDVVLMSQDLCNVPRALELGRHAMRKVRQNLFWAFFYNIIGIPIAAGALYPLFGFQLNPVIAGAAMAFSSVSVVTNSLLMRRWRPKTA